MLMMLKRYGIKDDESQEKVPYFLREVYTRCQEVGLTPQQVFDYISDIFKFSSEIPIYEIPKFMKKRIEEKEKLESEIQELSKKINELSDMQEEKAEEIERLSKMEETMTKTYQTFTIARYRLKQYEIGMDDIDQFVKCVVGISKEGYNPVQVLKKIAGYESLEKEANHYRGEVNLFKAKSAKLNQEINVQKNDLSYLKIKGDNLQKLEERGFGIHELRTLINILNEIGLENNQDYDETREEFFDDVKNYEEVIGSRKERKRLKNEIRSLEILISKEREKYNAYPKLIESINRLTGAGIPEEDIIKIDRILSMTYYYLYKDNRIYKEAFFDDLQKYGDLKLAIKNLEDIEMNLKSVKKTQGKPTKKKPNNVSKVK